MQVNCPTRVKPVEGEPSVGILPGMRLNTASVPTPHEGHCATQAGRAEHRRFVLEAATELDEPRLASDEGA
jgi:hypothetical protein